MGIKAKIDNFFGVTAAGSTFGVETRAGITTFLTMAYILFVNPEILGEAIRLENGTAGPQLLTATALAAAAGTLIMGLWARYPFALAPGMGINAYFAYTVVLGQGVPWQTALGAVFLSGLAFLAIGLAGIRELLVNAIPLPLKHAVTAGIGCFLTMLGLVNAGLVEDHPVTLVTLGSITRPGAWIALGGLILTTVLLVKKIPGAVLLGIFGASVAAVAAGVPPFDGKIVDVFSEGLVRAPAWPTDLWLAMDPVAALELGTLTIVFTFLFVDFFDTAGTLIGLSEKAGILGEDGAMPRARGAFCADALATAIGAAMGTSSTTSYIESSAGIEDGGKTGFTAVIVAALFLLSLFFWPLAEAVPKAATAPALITIGALMMFTCAKIPWMEYRVSVPAMLTILGMPLTFSITDGIALGLVAYAAIHLLTGRAKSVHWLMYAMVALLVLRYLFLAGR